jgi:hypothetical protein
MNAKHPTTPATPPTEPKRREKTPSRHASDAHDKIKALLVDCEKEIAASPESIRAKYEIRIAKVREGLDPDALELLEKMLGQ